MINRLSPLGRISLGLVSLTISMVLIIDIFFGLITNDVERARDVRETMSKNLAVQLTALIQSDDLETLSRTMHSVMTHNEDILSIAVRRSTGKALVEAGDHGHYWVAPADGRSTLTHVHVPIYAEQDRWGAVEISFRPLIRETALGWLRHPIVILVLSVSAAGFLFFYLYMRRMLEYLDPTSAIPERVRVAFDTLTEGVLVVNPKERIMLANVAFRNLHGRAVENLHGCRVSDLEWLKQGLPSDRNQYAWVRAMREREPIKGEVIEIPQEHDEPRKAVINCSPIQDGTGKVSGCLITFDDVTELERLNAQLLGALKALNASREQIEKQNQELKQLASCDPLTECLNRRAFFDAVKEIYRHVRDVGGDLCCVMTDIDRFKSINDRYGHGVGDQVIKEVAKILQSCLRKGDVLCRYGGEEFCIVLPNIGVEQAWEVTQRIRERIETECTPAITVLKEVKITSSFGIASIKSADTLEEIISQADQALYDAKNKGRNRVERFLPSGDQPVSAPMLEVVPA